MKAKKDLRLAAGYRAPRIMTSHDCGAHRELVYLTAREMVIFRCWKDDLTLKGTRGWLQENAFGHVGLETIRTTRLMILAKLGARNVAEAIKNEDARGVRL